MTDRFNGGAGQRIYIFNRTAATLPGQPSGVPPSVLRRPRRAGLRPRRSLHLGEGRAAARRTRDRPTRPRTSRARSGRSPNLTINLGFRWEVQDIGDTSGATATEIDDNYSPRVQLSWDPQLRRQLQGLRVVRPLLRDHPARTSTCARSATRRSASATTSARTRTSSERCRRRSPASASSILGGPTPVDPDLKGQYIDEYLLRLRA